MSTLEIDRPVSMDDMADVIQLSDYQHPQPEGVFKYLPKIFRQARDVGEAAVSNMLEEIQTLGHDLMHGDFSDKFKHEFDANRLELECEDGTPKTVRLFNAEFINNDRPAIVYTYSLAVPGAHGIELATLADIAKIGEETGQAVVAITTDGQAGKTTWEQKRQMTDFWNLVGHNFEVLRQVLPRNKHMVITGASLGGMMAHAMAQEAESESLQSDHPLHVDAIISIASAGHHGYSFGEVLAAGKQFTIGETRSGIGYVRQGKGLRQKLQRSFELLGTMPRHIDQIGAIACTAVGILKAPLKGGEKRIPHETKVFDVTLSRDGVTQPNQRKEMWEKSGHPQAEHVPEIGDHLDLLTRGRELTVMYLCEIAPPRIKPHVSVA